ncbi:MAG: histidine kinase dimerization/phosphoacceptor domain -containing protein [Spirochaetia bacterium]
MEHQLTFRDIIFKALPIILILISIIVISITIYAVIEGMLFRAAILGMTIILQLIGIILLAKKHYLNGVNFGVILPGILFHWLNLYSAVLGRFGGMISIYLLLLFPFYMILTSLTAKHLVQLLSVALTGFLSTYFWLCFLEIPAISDGIRMLRLATWSTFFLMVTVCFVIYFFLKGYETHTNRVHNLQIKLSKNEERFRRYFTEGPSIKLIINPEDGKIMDANKAAIKFYGYPYPKLTSMYIQEVNQLPEQKVNNHLFKAKKQLENHFYSHHKLANGEIRYVEVFSIPIEFEDGIHLKSTVHDISDIIRYQKELEKTIEEKDFLMKEMHHRIKNNLAMITSLINLQENKTKDREVINSLKHKINAIKLIHEKLQTENSLENIRIDRYLEELLTAVFSGISEKYVILQCEIEARELKTDLAIPLGLLVNEIALNAIKHSFSKGKTNVFTVTGKTEQNSYCLQFNNNGTPIPESVDIEHRGSLGLRLVQVLARQISADLEITRSPHPVFTITIPL